MASNDLLVAGSIPLDQVLTALRATRPVFHSEADLQHALAWEAHRLDADLVVRLETRPEPNVQLDLLLSRPDLGCSTVVELKYLTTLWAGEVGGEAYALKSQGGQDIRAYDIVKDLTRVERFIAGRTGWNGLVIVISNDPAYWQTPRHNRETNARAFRLHEGLTMEGVRAWGPRTGAGTMKGRHSVLELHGRYTCHWSEYSRLPGARGGFRLLAFVVK